MDHEDVEFLKTFVLKLDTTPVDFSNVTADSNLLIDSETNIGYVKESFVLNGITDGGSGIKSVLVKGKSYINMEYNTGNGIVIDSDVASIVLTDNVGNVVETDVDGIVSGLCSKVLFDSDAPVIGLSLVGTVAYTDNIKDYYTGVVSVNVSVSDENLDEVNVLVNNEELESPVMVDGAVNITYDFDESKEYTVSVSAKDKIGNEFSSSKSFVIDVEPPTKGSMTVAGKWFEVNGSLYTPATLTINGVPSDSLSGIRVIEVLKNNEVVSNALPYSITESGSYAVKALDNMGNVAEFSLADIAGTGTSMVVLDPNAPHASVNLENSSTPDYSGVNGYWYLNNPIIDVSASDENIKSVSVILNVDGVQYDIASSESNIENYKVDTTAYEGRNFSVKILAEDLSGNTNSSEYTFSVDRDAPYNIYVNSERPSSEKCGNVYYNGAFDISISAVDDGFGDLVYYLDGVSNKTGVFTGIGAGEHYIMVADGLGNLVKEKSLGDYLGWSSNNVVIITEAPIISATGFAGLWVASAPAYSATANDSAGINAYRVEVNGSVIKEEYYEGLDTTSISISFSLNGVQPADNGSYNVSIIVENNAGITNTWSDVVNLDTDAPTLDGIYAEGEWNEVDGEVYSGRVITITGNASDRQSGISSITIYKEENIVSTSLPYSISQSGSYNIVMVDNVGNSSTYYVKDLLGTESNNIVIDGEVPSLYFDATTTVADSIVNGVNWYNHLPVVAFSASDNNKMAVKATVTVDGIDYVDYDSNVIALEGYSIDTSKYSGSNYNITVTASDDSGNVCSISYSFNLDVTSPEVGSLSIVSDYIDTADGAYSGSGFIFSGEAVDTRSGISSVVIYKESKKVYESTTGVVDFSIKESSDTGAYAVVVKDNVGNQVTVHAKELLGSSSSVLIVDNDKPVISRTDSNIESAVGWYSYTPVLRFSVNDTNLKSYNVVVNDKLVRSSNVSEEFEVNLSEYTNTSVSIQVSAEDYTGNLSEYVYEYQHDNISPYEITASSVDPYIEKGGNVYFNGKLSVEVTALDDGFGGLIYYVNDVSNKAGLFTLSSDGEYFVKVSDGLGNISESIPLYSLMGWQGNNVIFDSSKPTVTALKYDGQWVEKAPVYIIGLNDDYGIDNVTVTVNGTEMVNKTYSVANATNESITVDLSSVAVAEDGSYLIEVVVTDNSGLVTVWSDVSYLDNIAPIITAFDIRGAVNSIGKSIDGGNIYGFFFDGSGSVVISASDNGSTSGIKSIWTRLEGYEWVENTPDDNGNALVTIPSEYKGSFEAYAVDNVGNIGSVNKPDMFVSETKGTHTKSGSLVITMPNTTYTDINGIPLYNSDVSVNILAGCSVSGISSVEWGIDEVTETIGALNATTSDNNLITEVTQGLGIVNNGNGMTLLVRVTDMVGHYLVASKTFSVDKERPVIDVTYNVTNESNHYNVTRVATVTVTEKNFKPEQFVIEGSYGTLGNWKQNGDAWTNTITFTSNGEYQFTLSCTDMASNDAVAYVSEKFVIDKTAPIIRRVDANVEYVDGWYRYEPTFEFEVAENYLSLYEVYINDELVDSGNSSAISVDTGVYKNMAVNIRVVVYDSAGNSDEYVYSYNHDNMAPKNVSAYSEDPKIQKAGTVYFNSPFNVTVSAEDGDGYGNLTYYLNDVASKDGRFIITESGEYHIKVVDGLGHESTSTELGALCGWTGNSVVVNNSVPTVEWSKHNGEWLSETCVYDVIAKSPVGIDSVVVTVNGTKLIDNSYDGTETLEAPISVDISKASKSNDSSYKTVITVTDNSGLVYTVEDIVYIDVNAPTKGSLSVSGEWKVQDNKIYTNGVITINGSPEDKESGIKGIEVLKNGEVVGYSLPYSIVESGKYSVKVSDNVGNEAIYAFSDISWASTSEVVWDSSYPVVYFDFEKSDSPTYTSGKTYWYAFNPAIYIGMTDDNMESVSVVVTIDGKDTVVVDNIVENGIYGIDTAFAKGTQFKVVAKAKDKSGNASEASYEFRVDTSKPQKGTLSAMAGQGWVEGTNGVYTNGSFVISGSPADKESGINSITVYKDGELFSNIVSGVVDIAINDESQSGSYSIEIIDNVGNTLTVCANELLGSVSNNFVVDASKPTVSRLDENKETTVGWYNYAPVLTFKISDDHIKEYTISVNGVSARTGNTSETVSLDMVGYQNQKVLIEINVIDCAGNMVDYSYSYNHDNTPPVNVVVKMGSPVSTKGSNVYYNGDIDVVITSTDASYGDISYYINGNRVDGGKYTISKSGDYSFEVVDGLGNTTEVITLADYFGWAGNNIVIDTSKPVVESNKYNGSWIQGNGSYEITITDDVGINSIVATVNGTRVVNEEISSVTNTFETILIDTSTVSTSEDGSYKTVVTVTDNSGLVTTWEDIVYADNTAPVVENFIVHGDVNRLNTSDGYGYFFNGNGTVDIVCNDGSASSGVYCVYVKFEGYDWVEYKVSSSAIVTVNVPELFKGTLEAYAVDRVGNKGVISRPAKLVSESYASHVSHQQVEVSMPSTPYNDSNGLPLYNSDISASILVGCNWSGLQSLEWGIGSVNKVTSFTGGLKDDNLITRYTQYVSLSGNANGITLNVDVADMANNTTSKSIGFSIDKDIPIIDVKFDNTTTNNYYKGSRVATITVNERNFDASKFVIGGNSGTLGSWSHDGDIWTNTITFSNDGNYRFTLDCTDRAGNSSKQYVSDMFVIDTTAPTMTVTWDNVSSRSDLYYNTSRTATITVVEENFNSEDFKLSGDGALSEWRTYDGNKHTAAIKFEQNGEYSFSIGGCDRAGNYLEEEYNSGEFIIDLYTPEIQITRVTDGVSYKDDVEFVVTISDTHIDGSTKVYLLGKRHNEIEVNGTFVGKTGTFVYTNFPKEEGVDDIYTIRVVGVDKAGNVSEETLTFSVNRFGSSYSFYDAEYLNHYHSVAEDLEISEVNVDRLDLDKISIAITRDGKEIDVRESWVNVTEKELDGKYLYTYLISKSAFMVDGKYSVTIMSASEDGTKYTSASEQYDFIIDTTAPVIIISGVEDGKDYREYSRTVAVDVRDTSGVGSIRFTVNGVEISNYSESDGIYSFNVTESGSYQGISVEVTDKAGNTNSSSVDNFLVTSNTMIYLMNQFWFLVLVALALFVIIVLIIFLILSRRKDKDDEFAALQASGELYRSSTGGSASSGTTGGHTGDENRILSGEVPTANDLSEAENEEDSIATSDMSDDSENSPTELMEDIEDVDTGIL